MGYQYIDNGFKSFLTGKEYHYSSRDEKYKAMERMLRDDAEVRDASQKRAQQAGMTRPISDHEIASGNWVNDPTIDRRTVTERVADQVAANPNTRHDPYSVAADGVRAAMRSNDSDEKRAADAATIARLEKKSADLAQQRAANPPAPELDPNTPAGNAAAMRAAAEQLRPASPLAEDQARHRRMVDSLLQKADELDTQAQTEQAHAAKMKDLEPWIVDSGASVYLLSKDPKERQENVNAVKDIHERLKAGSATKDEWLQLMERIDGERAARKQALLDANAEERKRLEIERTAIRNDKPVDPPADKPADPPAPANPSEAQP